MTVWYDQSVDRYRSTLPDKVFHEWGWPLLRRVLFCLPEGLAHKAGLRGTLWIDRIDRAWQAVTWLPLLAWLLIVVLPARFLYQLFWEKTGLLMVGPRATGDKRGR
jgi:hypothetical protein